MILFEIINQSLTHFGIVIFSFVKSYMILTLLLFAINALLLFFYKWHKIKRSVFIIKESIFLILIFVFIVIPFDRGRRIEGLKEIGNNLITNISQFKSITGKFPDKVELLYPDYINRDEFNLIKEKVSYAYFDREEVNNQNRNDKGFIPLKEDYFNLSIHDDFLGMEKLQYNMNLGKFILTDG